MKAFLTSLAILAFTPITSAFAALAVGANAPNFTARAAQGGAFLVVELSELLRKGPVVLYFFPSAFAGGCTAESHEFAEKIDEFHSAGATVVGMSRDTVEALARFSAEECASKFPLASADERIVDGFEVNDGAMFNTRTTYVIDPSGRIIFVYDDDDCRDHVKKTLAFIRSIKK